MNESMVIKAPAKINLGLTVLRRRPDGYHDLASVMQQVSLADTLVLQPHRDPGWFFYCSERSLSGKENLVCRAAALLVKQAAPRCRLPGVKIILYKNIPTAAGLGGGSSDAAAALKGLNSFWRLGMSPADLLEMGALLGSDIPYCLQGGTVLAGGRGETLEVLPALPFHWVVLAVPSGMSLSTAQVYGALEPAHLSEPHLTRLIEAISLQRKDLLQDWFAGGRTNTLEKVVLPHQFPLQILKRDFQIHGLYPALSGSGPAYFALTGCLSTARTAAHALQEAGNNTYLCWTIP